MTPLGLVAWWVSAAAAAQVPLESSELSGAIAGRVCRDENADGRCSASEPGVPGARVVLETGDVSIADSRGRYHFAQVIARSPDTLGGGRVLPGRHRVALDARTLGGQGASVPAAATLEVPMAGIAVQDFAVKPAPRTEVEVKPAPELAPPEGVLQDDGRRVRFLATGQVTPGDQVRVEGQPAEIDARGVYRAWVELVPGENRLSITAQAPSGAMRTYAQRIDVVARQGGVLVIPRPLEPTASLQLPATSERAASVGQSAIRIEAAPGTRIRHPGGELTVGPEGVAQLPVDLRSGENDLALSLERPGEPPQPEQLRILAVPRPLVAALLDLEATFNPRTGGLRLFGRGAGHGEVRFGSWELGGELELRDQDFPALGKAPWASLLPRSPERLERVVDPERAPVAWADDSVELSPNAPEGRLRVELRHDTFGRVGYGTNRAELADGEIGRYDRMTFGSYARVSAPLGERSKVAAALFFAPGGADPIRGLATAPAHDELVATGGSFYYLSHSGVAEGSEVVRVELRDGVTGLPLGERHLVRGRDYELDSVAGRLFLARPLSFVAGASVLKSLLLMGSPEQVLVVDYERVVLGAAFAQVAGGEAKADLGPVSLSVGGVDQRGASTAAFQLGRARASVALGPISLHAEGALSRGQEMLGTNFALSDDGGLSFFRAPAPVAADGRALTLLARGPGLSSEGHVDAAVRYRSAGFSDQEHLDLVDHRQVSLRAEQPFGPFVVGVLADLRSGQDPRTPDEARSLSARRLGLSAGYRMDALEVRLEADDAELTATPDVTSDVPAMGGRFAVGAFERYRLLPSLALIASQRYVLALRGAEPGRFDDTFFSAGAELELPPKVQLGVRAGWGPRLGPLAWLEARHHSGTDTYYGSYSVDVDGPDYGTGRAVMGARTAPGDGTEVFVEDIAAHDTNAVRLSRAVGFTQAIGPALEVSSRYEHGVRSPLDAQPTLARDAGGASAMWVLERVRLYGHAELRRERGRTLRGIPTLVDRLQGVGSAAADVALLENLRFSGRLNFAHTTNAKALEQRLVEGTAALAWRFEPGLVVARYSVRRELLPPDRGSFGERSLQTLSLLPAVRLGSHFSLSAGAHAGWSTQNGNTSLVLSGSLRPAVRVVGGLELGAEVAGRSSAPDGGELLALRGEAGYRFGDQMMLALGYTLFGFSGLGLSAGEPGNADRLYLRAELAY